MKANTETKLLTKLMYSMSYPLKKEGEYMINFFKTKIIFKI